MTAPMTESQVMALAVKFAECMSDYKRRPTYETQHDAGVFHDAIRAAVELLAQQARAKALEDAAKKCSELWHIDGQFTADEFAEEIRAMK